MGRKKLGWSSILRLPVHMATTMLRNGETRMSSDERAYAKINRILSRLEPAEAAGLARRLVDEYGGAEQRKVEKPDRSSLLPRESRGEGDARPSFLQTQHRMEVGKHLLEHLNKEDPQGSN
jgi:hypothetical protein